MTLCLRTQAGHLPSIDLVKVRSGEGIAVNIKDGFDNPDGVSARAKGFLLMIEKFQDKVRTHPPCLTYRVTKPR